jgi:hypothetical protein
MTDVRAILEAARDRGASGVRVDEAHALAAASGEALDAGVWGFASEHGAEALTVLAALAAPGGDRAVRRAAKRALYRLAQRGVTAPAAPAPRPVVERRAERAVRAWLSGIDGGGSRATWILFDDGWGGLRLCSLIVNDVTGIVEAAGGEVTKRRLERELAALRASQKLPWVEAEPERAVGLVAEALARHEAAHTSPPANFARWRPLFAAAPPAAPPPPAEVDTARLARSPSLLDRPELAGWFLEPTAVQGDAVDLLQARESRLVVPDQIKAEREAAIVDRVIERELTPEARQRWWRRLLEMALVFEAAGDPEPAALARAAAAALADDGRDPRSHPLVRALAQRALEVAGEVALGRVSSREVTRQPAAGGPAAPE